MQYYKDIKEYTQKQEQDMLWSMFDDIWPQHQFADIEERTLALESNCWNQSKAARQLGMGRTLLIHKMKKYELSSISY
jgi:transcriptional regulator of acetoin/glycerol metabolism